MPRRCPVSELSAKGVYRWPMKRFVSLGIAISVAVLLSAPVALAKSAHADNGDGQDNASENNGKGGHSGQGQSGNAGSSGNIGNNLQSHIDEVKDAAEGPTGAFGDTTASESAPAATDQDAALDAVESGQAMPLENIVSNVEENVGGQVLDAHQVTVRGFLIYEIKVLDAGGRVKNLYYYAKSGLPVGR